MSVPLCLRGRFTVTSPNGNEYTTNITDIVPQRYSSPSGAQTYTGSNIQVGMYASTSSDGRIFRIKSVGIRTATSLTGAILEDIEGLNKRFDSNGNQVGNPENGGGYIFELNSEGLPMLTNIGDPLSPQFTDSLMGRFIYDRNSVRNVSKYRSIQLFARGAGKNVSDPENGNEPYARRVVLNQTIISEESGDTTKRGLYLTILKAGDFSVVSTTQYDTAGTTNAEAGNLATALNTLTREQIGILTSYREWERKIENGALITAANRLGLTKLAQTKDTTNQGRPYAAIFYGGGTDSTNVGSHDTIERMESNDPDAPLATISATLVTDGKFASITGASSTNALYSADSNSRFPKVVVNSAGTTVIDGDLGVATSSNLANLTVFKTGQVLTNINTNPITSQLAVTTDSQRLYIGSYYTGGTLACSALQASDYFSSRDNPTTLCLNPRGGQVNIGYGLAYTGSPTFDVNGTIRGKGGIVNVSTYSHGVGYWTGTAVSPESYFLDIINITYTPKQTGAVTIICSAQMQVAFVAGSGPDLVGWQVDNGTNAAIIEYRHRYWNDYLVGRTYQGDPSRFGHMAVRTINGATTFRLRLYKYSDDQPVWTNAFLIIQELSQT